MIKVQITVSPTNIIPLDVPDEQFVSPTDAAAIAHEIPGSNTVGSMLPPGGSLVAYGDDLNTDGSSKREWLNIKFDSTRWPNCKFAEPAFVVLQKKAAMIAAWKSYVWKEGADGSPDTVEVPKPVVPVPPAQNPPNSFPGFPGSQPAQVPVYQQQIQAIYDLLFPNGHLKQ